MDRATGIAVDDIRAEAEQSKSNNSVNIRGLVALPVLWHFTVSHFNEKVRWALDWKGLPHVRRSLVPLFHVPRVVWMTGKSSLPVLVLDGKAIADSTRIIAALERLQPEPCLYPRDSSARRRALELEDFFDEELGPAIRAMLVHDLFVHDPDLAPALFTVGMDRGRRALRILSPVFRPLYRFRHQVNAASAAVGREKMLSALDRIERELQPSGYLVGDGFSVADLTAAALLYPLVQPPEFPYPWPRPLPASLEEHRVSLAGRAAFQWVGEMYSRHRGTSAEVAV
jgi:glutathione S-transferase